MKTHLEMPPGEVTLHNNCLPLSRGRTIKRHNGFMSRLRMTAIVSGNTHARRRNASALF